jgi:XTP/dITP diphosphohydrolase
MNKMKIYFVTTNKHKFAQVKEILKDYPIEMEHLDMSYDENHDDSMQDIAKTAAKKLANELKKPIVLEDTGLYFKAYNGFPGALPKFVFNTIGFKGIFKLLEGESRKAYFIAVAAFCEPGKEPVLFEGIMNGKIDTKVHDEEKDDMPYAKIFIPEGSRKTFSSMTLEEKSNISHRGEAFKKFGEYVKKKVK